MCFSFVDWVLLSTRSLTLRILPLIFLFMVLVESLLVASRVDDGHLMGLLEQVNYVLCLHGSVAVESLHSWGAMVEVGGQHCLSSIG